MELIIIVLIILGISLSIIFMAYILNKDTKNNNTKLTMGILLVLIGIIAYIVPTQWAAENLMIIKTYHYLAIVLYASINIIIGIIGISKSLVHR